MPAQPASASHVTCAASAAWSTEPSAWKGVVIAGKTPDHCDCFIVIADSSNERRRRRVDSDILSKLFALGKRRRARSAWIGPGRVEREVQAAHARRLDGRAHHVRRPPVQEG